MDIFAKLQLKVVTGRRKKEPRTYTPALLIVIDDKKSERIKRYLKGVHTKEKKERTLIKDVDRKI